MLRAFTKLTVLDWVVVISGLWLVLLIPHLHWPVAKPSRLDAAFQTWRSDADGFGAFARGPDGRFGWAYGRNTLAAAQEDALAHCNVGRRGCEVTDVRDATVHHPDFDTAVAPRVARLYDDFLTKPGFKAFAMTEGGVVGYWSGAPTAQAAQQGALATCRKYKKGRSEYLPDRPCIVVIEAG